MLPILALQLTNRTAASLGPRGGFPQRQTHTLKDDHNSHLLQQRHTQQNSNTTLERAEAAHIPKRVDGSVDEPHEEERQARRDGEEDPLLARLGVGGGHGEEDRKGEDGGEGGDEEGEADFTRGLRFVDARGAVVVARVDAADDAEDDADRVEDLGELDVAGRDGRLVGLVDVGLDSAEEAAAREKVDVSGFFFALEKGGEILSFLFFSAVRDIMDKTGF